MGIRLAAMVFQAGDIIHGKSTFNLKQQLPHHRHHQKSSAAPNVPKGHFAIYVGEEEEKKRFVVPINYLKHPLFQNLSRKAEEEFGFDHQMGALMIPCPEDEFILVTYG